MEHGSHYFVLVCRQRAICMQTKSNAEKHTTIVEGFFFFREITIVEVD